MKVIGQEHDFERFVVYVPAELETLKAEVNSHQTSCSFVVHADHVNVKVVEPFFVEKLAVRIKNGVNRRF